ncbi:ATP-binding protein [Nonomuraea sp. NPDC049714]|uniref:ATP-binding protein n=1 Tax=Nonomuraea sp. NPDC049714 TaxID=3364357 RepID=UPI0037B99B99
MRPAFEVVTDSEHSTVPDDLKSRVFLLPLAPEASYAARQCIREVLTVWRLPDLVESARLLATELVKNAVQHAAAWGDSDLPVRLLLMYTARTLRIEVRDPDPHRLPVWRVPAELSEFGYGVPLMHSIADRCGVRILKDGKAVWCEVDRPENPSLPRLPRTGGKGRFS